MDCKEKTSSARPTTGIKQRCIYNAFNEVKEKGKLNSTIRTADQTAYAKYWYEFSEAGWNRVARVVAVNKKLGLYETARLFALVDIAMADAYIAGWDSKLHYNFGARTPLSARQRMTETIKRLQICNGNRSNLLHRYRITLLRIVHWGMPRQLYWQMCWVIIPSFTMASPTAVPAGGTRSFTSFSQAAKENADSRVRAGIHFRFACDAGLELGKKIGNWTVNNFLSL